MRKVLGLILTSLITIAICSAFCQGGPTAQCKDGTYSYSKIIKGRVHTMEVLLFGINEKSKMFYFLLILSFICERYFRYRY